MAAVTSVTKVLWPDSQTVLFGSQATSLALPGSDLDIVVLGVSENITNAASGFTRYGLPDLPAVPLIILCFVYPC